MRLIIALFKRKTENLCKRAQYKLACNCTASVAKFQFHKVVLKRKAQFRLHFKLLHRMRQITKHTPHRFAELPYLKGAPYRL